MRTTHYIIAAAIAAAAVACSHGPQGWTLRGTVPSVKEGQKVAIEAFNPSQGVWYGIDSVEVGQDGQFSYTAATPSPYPDIYRVSLGQQAVYFPIDSLETVTLTGAKDALTPARISGTPLAATMTRVDSLIAVQPNDSLLKRQLTEIILSDDRGLISYYVITKTRQGRPLFDPSQRRDLSIIGAVANKYVSTRPDDPRTPLLKDVYLKNRASLPEMASNARQIEAQTTGLFDINLYDRQGASHSLKDMASKGHVTILSFTSYAAETSPAYTALLRQAWDRSHAAGLDIYEVSIDPQESVWKTASERLPWVSVYSPATQAEEHLRNYNVTSVPATFIINRQGDLAERVTDPRQLQQALAKYL